MSLKRKHGSSISKGVVGIVRLGSTVLAPAVFRFDLCRARQVAAGALFSSLAPLMTVRNGSLRGAGRRTERDARQQKFCAGGIHKGRAGREGLSPARTFGAGSNVVRGRNSK